MGDRISALEKASSSDSDFHFETASASVSQRIAPAPSSSSDSMFEMAPIKASLCSSSRELAGKSSSIPAKEHAAEPKTLPRFALDAIVLMRSLSLSSRIAPSAPISIPRGSRASGGGTYSTPFFSDLLAYLA